MTREMKTKETKALAVGKGALLAMLGYKRPYESPTEIEFIKKWLIPLADKDHVHMTCDAMGNIIVKIGDNPTIGYSSHTDTVHHSGGKQALSVYKGTYKKTDEQAEFVCLAKKEKPKQKRYYDKKLKKYVTKYTYNDKASNCLGADDTTGVWLMREMIIAGKEGLYIFHRGEEEGGIGSKWIVKNTPELVDGVKCMIAFDRMDRDEIITNQMGKCASDKFARSLGDILYEEDTDIRLMPSDMGVYTDSAEYTGLIGECTNVAVGYFGHHGQGETQDLTYALKLRDALVSMNTDNLVFDREAGEEDPFDDWGMGRYGYGGGYGGSYAGYQQPGYTASGKLKNSIYSIIYQNPWEISQWLEELGYDAIHLDEQVERIKDEN